MASHIGSIQLCSLDIHHYMQTTPTESTGYLWHALSRSSEWLYTILGALRTLNGADVADGEPVSVFGGMSSTEGSRELSLDEDMFVHVDEDTLFEGCIEVWALPFDLTRHSFGTLRWPVESTHVTSFEW